jgi:hypothetical protein
MAEGKAVFTAATLEDKRNLPGKDHLGPRDGQQEAQAPITVIIGGRALLMLIAARFSGSLLKKISRQLAPAVKG